MSIYWLLAIPVLFILVIWNNKNNQHKLRNRKGRNFRQGYFEKKKEKDEFND
ncbi:hypothetical protein ACFQ1M_17830 [Sungkyunkwania multivorans]|uniref:ATP synthase F0 subunit 8 n=1 Tax=Sungkyunkwania multivorans TaxID=1173618 RepID=A0ABW3D4J4_9FLAO